MPASSTTRRSCISPHRPRACGRPQRGDQRGGLVLQRLAGGPHEADLLGQRGVGGDPGAARARAGAPRPCRAPRAAGPPSTARSSRRPADASATASRSRSSRTSASAPVPSERAVSQPRASAQRPDRDEQDDLHARQGPGHPGHNPGRQAASAIRRGGLTAVPLKPVSLTIGIVGLPNVGKSTLFNALTKNDVLAANYPFATIEPNVGVVGVPDPRLAVLAEIFGSAKHAARHRVASSTSPASCAAPGGGGAGQQVPRQHPRERRDLPGHPRVPRPERRARRRRGLAQGRHRDDQHRADPRRPADHREGAAAAARRRRGSTEGARPRSWPRSQEAQELLRERHDAVRRRGIVAGIDTAAPARAAPADRQAVPLRLQRRRGRAGRRGASRTSMRALVAPAEAIFLDAKIEAELAELPDDEALELLQSMGQEESGLDQLPASASTPSACRPTSRPARRSRAPGRSRSGATAPQAAGVIHTDFQRASSRPRSSPTTTWSTPARWPRPRRAARCASRARTT